MRRIPRRVVPWAALALMTVLAAGGAALGAGKGSGPGTTTGAATRPATAVTRPATAPVTTTPVVPPGPANPSAPGPLAVDATAWKGHGDLAFVSRGQLEVLSDAGVLTAITGPPAGGSDSNPSWSSDGQWLAFLNTGPASGYAVPAPTLWVLGAGSPVAREVSATGVGMFAWSPVASTVAYTAAINTESNVPGPEDLWLDQPGSPPVKVPVGTGNGVDAVAWSPDGSQLAFDDFANARLATATSPYVQPVSDLGVVSDLADPAVSTVFRLTGTGIRLAGWWPEGGGLLFWEDPGYAESADGQILYSLASQSDQPVVLAPSLVGPTWLAPDPAGHTVAVVAGRDRTIWTAGRDIDLCTFPAATCQPVALPAGVVGLAPSWTASGALVFAEASASGPFGPGGDAYYSPGWMAQWDATNSLWTTFIGAGPEHLASAPGGALLAAPAANGSSMVVVADDALWLVDTATGAPAVRVAGPLYSTVGPSGYYGEVDWSGTFSWSQATALRQESGQLLDESLFPGDAQLP